VVVRDRCNVSECVVKLLKKTWLSIKEMADQSNVPESTTRRYLQRFDAFFRYEKRSRGRRYHYEGIPIISQVKQFYDNGYEAEAIEEILMKQFPFVADDEGLIEQEKEVLTPIPTTEDIRQVVAKEVERATKSLHDEIRRNQDYINKRLEERDKRLMEVMSEMLEQRREIAASTEKKGFWVRLFGGE